MRRLMLSLGVVFVACGESRAVAPPPPQPPPAMTIPPIATPPVAADPSTLPAAAAGDAVFAAALFDQVRKVPGNICVSPASVRLALAMTALGAAGTTADELHQALALPAGSAPADVDAGFAAMLADFAARGTAAAERASTIAIANRIWPQLGKPLLPGFVGQVKATFGAEPQPLDYARDPAAARTTINAWVAAQTAQRIPALLAPSHVTADTRLILTNAIYLKARWQTPFVPARTAAGTFTTAAGTKVPVQLMKRVGAIRTGVAASYRVVELPYTDGSLVMQLLLPSDGHTLAEVEAEALLGLGAMLQSRQVDLQVPRFTLRSNAELRPVLEAMGIRIAFTSAADFSGIDGGADGLYLGNVVHAADLVLDEGGTEAAAATAVLMPRGGPMASDAPVPFVVDRPIVFVLRDHRTDTILFVGRLADPSA